MASVGVVVKKLTTLVSKTSPKRWTYGIYSRLPEYVKARFQKRDEVHQKWILSDMYFNKTPGVWEPGPDPDTLQRVVNHPMQVIYPAEADEGLWGGEGIVKAITQKKIQPKHFEVPNRCRVWRPYLYNTILYSEILDKHLDLIITERVHFIIDEMFGLDHYILGTPEHVLNSRLGLSLKKQMLLALIDKTTHTENPDKQIEIYKQYSKYINHTREEIEWMDLSEEQALDKQRRIEEGAERSLIKPLREKFMEDLIAQKRAEKLAEASSTTN